MSHHKKRFALEPPDCVEEDPRAQQEGWIYHCLSLLFVEQAQTKAESLFPFASVEQNGGSYDVKCESPLANDKMRSFLSSLFHIQKTSQIEITGEDDKRFISNYHLLLPK